jgi:UDP:flavonoid glycosyltransferase YjiC (YdhE family)
MRIAISAAGSRGDIQPMAGLAAALADRGHDVRLICEPRFADLVDGRGVEHRPVSGDAKAELEQARELFEKGDDPLTAARTMRDVARRNARTGVPELVRHVSDTDLLVTSGPTALFGLSVAERLNLPAVQAYLQPVVPTRAFPSPLAPLTAMPSWTNFAQHWVGAHVYWHFFRSVVNESRRDLGLEPWPVQGPFARMRRERKPVLLAHSRHVLPSPPDWDEAIHVTGYWFLDRPAGWRPPAELERFIAAGPPPVYIGFGSMILGDAQAASAMVAEAVRQAGCRAVVSAGWGGLKPAPSASVFPIDCAPHDWLFPRMAAVVHHGGAGTTAAALRAGKPSFVTPFIADQFFWSWRLEKCGVAPTAVRQEKLTAEDLARGLERVLGDGAMRARAARLGELIRQEDGVGVAAEVIEAAARGEAALPRKLAV